MYSAIYHIHLNISLLSCIPPSLSSPLVLSFLTSKFVNSSQLFFFLYKAWHHRGHLSTTKAIQSNGCK